jgi:predicted short-subunit dehydrogenase-like oxidoreductase (DUF2520 family)
MLSDGGGCDDNDDNDDDDDGDDNNNNNNKIKSIGSLAVPVLRYDFGIVNWHQAELQKLDRKTRKLLTIHGQHHPKADVDRLHVPRKQGGRGLMQ